MRRVVADSSVWIDYFRDVDTRETAVLDASIALDNASALLVVPDLVCYEVLAGASSEGVRRRIDRLMRGFEVVGLGGETAVVSAAARYRHLRRRGMTIRKSIDVLIASWCLDHDAALLHRDRDFEPFVDAFGLKTV